MKPISPYGKFVSILNRARESYLAKRSVDKAMTDTFGIKAALWGKSDTLKFLDLGSGAGFASILAARDGFEAYALDIKKSWLLYERERKLNLKINLIRADGQRLPFRDSTFDVVYCCHVLEHIGDDSKTLVEIHQVLKENGLLLLSVPNMFNLFTGLRRRLNSKNPFSSPEHLREYSKEGLTVLLNNCDFNILGVRMTGFLLPVGKTIFNFALSQVGLQNIRNWFAKRFPESSESIDVIVTKKAGIRKELELQHQEKLFPLPWWLRK